MPELTRRQVLLGISGLVGSAIVDSSKALAKTGRPKLYVIDDYVDPRKEPLQFGKIYLDTVPGISLVHVWSTVCKPCIIELPEYNKLFSRYQNKDGVSFISALVEGALAELPKISPEQFVSMCIPGPIISKYPFNSPEYKRIMDDFESPPYSEELTKIVQDCERSSREYSAGGSHPERRIEIGKEYARFKAQKEWTNFPTYVLDDSETYDFLRGEDSTIPYTTFLLNGRYHSTIRGSGKVKAVERKLQELITAQERK